MYVIKTNRYWNNENNVFWKAFYYDIIGEDLWSLMKQLTPKVPLGTSLPYEVQNHVCTN
jgi:hypothetical protein